jgi:hypothetical protein
MTAFWGVDPSTQRVSIAYVTDNDLRHVMTRSFRQDLDDGARWAHVYAETFELCRALYLAAPPRLVLVEQPFASPKGGNRVHPSSYMAIAGIMIAAVRVTEAQVRMVNVSSWKARAYGKGNGHAGKDFMMAWARGQGYQGDLQDEADAYGLAEAARQTAGVAA